MKILLFGKKHDPAKELEIFHTDVEGCEHGFIAKIVNKERLAHDGRVICKDGDIDMCYNITEFHYLYNPNSLALESDIHGTGWAPWDIEERFHSIEITKADKLYPSYDG
jgi:hypothetical protein